jgi:hypothetical protein
MGAIVPNGVFKRTANLRRNRKTTISKLREGDVVTAEFDAEKHEWRLRIESSDAPKINHERVTSGESNA